MCHPEAWMLVPHIYLLFSETPVLPLLSTAKELFSAREGGGLLWSQGTGLMSGNICIFFLLLTDLIVLEQTSPELKHRLLNYAQFLGENSDSLSP